MKKPDNALKGTHSIHLGMTPFKLTGEPLQFKLFV